MRHGRLLTIMRCSAKTTYLVAAILFVFLSVSAQPKPGEERITIELPSTYRWKSKKIPKDTKGIRGTLYAAAGKDTEAVPVDSVTITTIDKRYYPVKAEGIPEEKLAYIRIACSDATLEIVNSKTVPGRTAILYVIKGTNGAGGCGSSTLLTYVAEGPTALHTIELHIPAEQYSQEVFKLWCDILLGAKIA